MHVQGRARPVWSGWVRSLIADCLKNGGKNAKVSEFPKDVSDERCSSDGEIGETEEEKEAGRGKQQLDWLH